MKTRTITLLAALVLVMSLALVVGCTQGSSNSGAKSAAAEEFVGMPTLAPADHDGRFEFGGGNYCYTCHGNGDAGNPMEADAVAIPENHYANGSYDSKAIDPPRMQCNTCHSVAAAE
ncbi:MAG: hypothetical protein LBB46_00205 [Coriobacteriaceae bacterium]|jgi:cytochrome c-type protein NapB|nr:hypothetical protein [Coriobacteriaceae bacterium]